MRFSSKILFLIIVIEISSLVLMGDILGFWLCLFWMIASTFAGGYLLKNQGMARFIAIRRSLQQGQMPAQEICDGLLFFIAAIALIIPGFLSDSIGILLWFPPTRMLIYTMFVYSIQEKILTHLRSKHYQQPQATKSANIIEGEFEHKPSFDKEKD